MAIREDGVSAVSVGELLDQRLQIPDYQRPYSWEPATALQLLDDISHAQKNAQHSDPPYVLGAVILHRHGDQLDVVDGQQRILTLRLIILLLEEAAPLWLTDSADNPVSRVCRALGSRIGALDTADRRSLGEVIRDRCQLVQVMTDDIDEAFRVFDSQNYRGKPLAPHDLLKAHHLREMRQESPAMKAAVVETWEAVRDDDLDRLFSTYLYRIARWSRGESAPGFTTHDIDMFKGISPNADHSPRARYHLAAQAAIPMLSAWAGSPTALPGREADRARFQLDAPLVAGRPFFEMVTFMLDELRRLAQEAFDDGVQDFTLYDLDGLDEDDALVERPSRSRYRYVTELYLAALLYYTNTFGDENLTEARHRLFAWAYAPRVRLLRVQFRSVDNRARGQGPEMSAFTLLRDADSGRAVRQLPASGTPYSDQHELQLVAALKGLGA